MTGQRWTGMRWIINLLWVQLAKHRSITKCRQGGGWMSIFDNWTTDGHPHFPKRKTSLLKVKILCAMDGIYSTVAVGWWSPFESFARMKCIEWLQRVDGKCTETEATNRLMNGSNCYFDKFIIHLDNEMNTMRVGKRTALVDSMLISAKTMRDTQVKGI